MNILEFKMKENRIILLITLLGAMSTTIFAGERISNGSVEAEFAGNGNLSTLVFKDGGQSKTVNFRNDAYAGPSFGIDMSPVGRLQDRIRFEGEKDGIGYEISYVVQNQGLDVVATVTNHTDLLYAPSNLPFVLGVDTYMDRFPAWNNQYYPTFFRCEENNFWGYFMTPKGDVLTVSSPDSIGSYQYDYLNEKYGHYIYTLTLNLLCGEPLPPHHPRVAGILPKGKKQWRLRFQSTDNLEAVADLVGEHTQASLIDLGSHSLSSGQPVEIGVSRGRAKVGVTAPSGVVTDLGTVSAGKSVTYRDAVVYGLYTVKAVSENDKISTASFYVHPSWEWYLNRARENALVFVPRSDKGNDSCETWYQLMAFYLAEKYNPDPALKKAGDELLDQILDRLFTEEDGRMYSVVYPARIQNVSAMISLLSLKYKADRDLSYLEKACKCANYLLSRQHEEGYYCGQRMGHYTSVIYIAKSIMELMEQIAPLVVADEVWKSRYDAYYASVDKAMGELSRRGLDVKTEGMSTYEDGAVSCSAAQLLKWALMKKNPEEKAAFQKSGMEYLESHACLARLLDPDARSHGATSRYWESWGDIRTPMQAMLSPHGWSGWRLYAMYYGYLLTGDFLWLRQFMDAMGACAQLIDFPSGKLHYAFVVDPHYSGGRLLPDADERCGKFYPEMCTAGYLDMIGDWYGRNTEGDGYLDRSKWDWDGAGTAFEIFKAMEETVMTNAFVCEDGDALTGYNCRVESKGGQINVCISDRFVNRLHLNLGTAKRVTIFRKGKKQKSKEISKGMHWVDL